MGTVMDPIMWVNTVLCITIFILGYFGFKKEKNIDFLLIGAAFGIFAISHLLNILGLYEKLMNFMIIIRVIAYLFVVFALGRVLLRD